MKVEAWLKNAVAQFKTAGIGTADLDALILLEDETGKDRAWLLAHPETTLQGPSLRRLKILCSRRMEHEPLAYIRGKTEFYGREFLVNKDVLQPRPESETMVELLKKIIFVGRFTLADIGTGSGALAITAKLEIPNVKVIGTDIDAKCLAGAEKNASSLKADIDFYKRDLLEDLPVTADVILANLPYVPSDYHINEAAAMEPKKAIFGGPDGLDLYRMMFEQIAGLPKKPMFVLTESLPPQHKDLLSIAKTSGYKLKTSEDFIQVFEKGV